MSKDCSWRRLTVDAAVALLLTTLTIATYAPVVSFEFVEWDDQKYVSENPVVQRGLTLDGVAYAFTTFELGNWIPLTWLSLELDATLFGADPGVFHSTNMLWHAANVCLVYFVLRGLTGKIGSSLVVGAFFAVHPLHVESVAWVAERKDVLSTFWLLVAVLAYAAYARKPSRWRMFVVGVAMAAGLLAKPMLVTLPVLLLLLDIWPLRRAAGSEVTNDQPPVVPCSWLELVIEKRSLFVLAFLFGLITVVAQQSQVHSAGGKTLPAIIRVGNAVYAYGWYLRKTVWPAGLCAFYVHPTLSLPWSNVAAAAIVLGAISAWAWLGRREHPYRLVGWLWFLVALLPVIGLLQVGSQAYADRYAYVPHIGLFLLMVWEARRFAASFALTRRGWSWMPIGSTVLLVGACVWVTRAQMETWRDTDALWTQALDLDPEHPMAHLQLGSRDLRAGDLASAEDHFRRVLFQQPYDFKPVLGLAQVHELRGDHDQAAEHYAWVLRLNPKDQYAAYRFAQLRPGEPLSKDVAKPEPKPQATSPFRSGLVSYNAGRTTAALQQFLEAVRLDPHYADAHHNAGLMLKELGRTTEARSHFETAIELIPNSSLFHFSLAVLLEEIGDKDSAQQHYEAVQRLSPSDPEPAFRIERLKRL
jgi:protein O-mannosyl-transferase